MTLGLSMDDRARLVDAALAAGLRAIPVAELVDATDASIEARLLMLTWLALRTDPFEPVYVAPAVRVRVAAVLAEPGGDAVLERVSRWLATGRRGLDA